jgi:hypothetical protein
MKSWVFDKVTLIHEVRRILPDVRSVGVTGSAAFDCANFKPGSDLDVVALNPRNCFAWSELGGHEVEIEAFAAERIKLLVQNPQWHGTRWIWNIGKIGGAEFLYGPSLESLVRSQISPKTRLIAAAELIGVLLCGKDKLGTGRRPLSLDVPLVLTALRRIVSDSLPIRAAPDEDLKEYSLRSDFSRELESAKALGEESRSILLDNEELGKITYYPEHRAGLRWLRRAMNIELEMPAICYLA